MFLSSSNREVVLFWQFTFLKCCMFLRVFYFDSQTGSGVMSLFVADGVGSPLTLRLLVAVIMQVESAQCSSVKGLQADTAASSSLHRPAAITHRTLEGPTTCRGNKKEKKRRFSLFKAFSLFRNTGSVALPTDDKQLEDCFL